MRPSLLTVNPQTGQAYTPSELADLKVNNLINQYNVGNSPYGDTIVRSEDAVLNPFDKNEYSSYFPYGYQIGQDNQEVRAQLQPWYEQLGRGVAKGTGIAVTTFLDGTAGFIAGLINMAVGDRDQDVLNRFVNNPISNGLLDLNEIMERELPNYMTQDEMNSPWYQRLATSNFWGDTILKNMGFAVGAVGAGMVSGWAGAQALGINRLAKTSKLLSNISKGIQEGKQLTQAEANVLKALSAEDLAALKNGQAIDELIDVGKALKAKTAQNQLLSSFVGAVGEGRIQALQDGRDYKKVREQELDAKLDQGEISREEYDKEMTNLENNTLSMQNASFVSNAALLSLFNYVQFRNVFSKGFTPTRSAATEVANLNSKGLYEIEKRGFFGKAADAGALLKNPISEMSQEQLQFAVTKGLEHYYDLKTDPESQADVKNYISSMMHGLGEAYGTDEGWENAAAGFIIGALGVPVFKKDSRLKIGIAGGIREDYKEQKAANEGFRKNIDSINTLLEDSPLKKMFDAATVDASLQRMFDESVQDNDRMNGKTINSMQLANMVDLFVETGKYDDFVSMIKDESALSATELREKYKTRTQSAVTGKDVEVDFFKGMTDDQVLDYIKRKGETAQRQAEQIKKIKQSIDNRFLNHSPDAKKDLLLKAAAVLDIDERIVSLMADIKEQSTYFYAPKGIKEFEDTAGVLDFLSLTTPIDLENYLKTEKGLTEYEKLIDDYLTKESNPEKALEFSEKARDLYELVNKRQAFNDTYFAMADADYASNKDALNQSNTEQQNLANKAQELRYQTFYDQNTRKDDVEGFWSTKFEVDNGKRNKVTVTGIDRATGQPITLEDAFPDDSKPGFVDEQGNVVKRQASTGNVFANYKAVINGQERQFEIINPQETTQEVDDKISLEFQEGDPNNLYDADGNAYALSELEQDPAFLASNPINVQTQRTEFINKVRRDSLQKLIVSNENLIANVQAQINNLEDKIKETRVLLERAQRNKSGRVRINGTKKVAKVFELEAALAEHEARLEELAAEKEVLQEEGQRLAMVLQQAVQGGFNPQDFADDMQTVQRQVALADESIALAQKKAKALRRTITALKNLLKVVYPKFKKAYMDLYGVDPSTVSDIIKRWETDVQPILRKLRKEEIDRYEQITLTEAEYKEALDAVAELQQYLADSQQLLNKIEAEKLGFEKALSEAFLARRIRQGIKTSKDQATPTVDKELDDTQAQTAQEFVSAKRSVNDMFSTAGQHFDVNDKINPKPWAQRWFRAIAKINLSKGNYSLKVVTASQKPELFTDVPEGKKDEALAVILYKDGKPVDEAFQPISEDATDQLLYAFVPLPTLETADFGPKFRDANQDPTKTQELVDKLTTLRTELLKRANENKASFLPVTEKSAGLLQTTGAKRSADQDLTTAVWTTLFKSEEDAKQNFSDSSIVLAKAKTAQEVEDGTATIYVGGKPVTVRNGLTYFITADAVVVPLLSRKINNEEAEVIFDMLTSVALGNNELGADKEIFADQPVADKKKYKPKKKFKRVYNATQARAAKKKGKKLIKNRKGQLGYYEEVKTATKTDVEAAKKAAGKSRINLLKYISDLIYFGPQTKGPDSTLISNPNKQTEIFISPDYSTLKFYDFNKNQEVTIPFTPESLKIHEEALMTFLANKYHQIKNSQLGKEGEFKKVVRVVKDDAGTPIYVETERYTSYNTYLVSNKSGKNAEGKTEERSVEDIPLTTNAVTDSNNEVIVKSTYLKYSGEVADIQDAPTSKKAGAAAAPIATPVAQSPEVLQAEAIVDKIDSVIKEENFTDEVVTEIAVGLSKNAALYTEELKKSINEAPSPTDAIAQKLKATDENAFENYELLYKIKQALTVRIATQVGVNTAAAPDAFDTAGGSMFNADSLEAMVNGMKAADAQQGISDDEDIDDAAPENLFRTQGTADSSIDIEKAKSWLAANMPQLSVKVRNKLINGIAQGSINPDGVLQLSSFAEEGTEYHEAMHGVMLGILSDEELAEVYKEAKSLYGKPTEEQLQDLKKVYPRVSARMLEQLWYDEKIAEGFREYALRRDKIASSSVFKKLYDMFLDLIEAVQGLFKAKTINSIFNKLYTGQYASAEYNKLKARERSEAFTLFKPIQGLTEKKGESVAPMDIVKAGQITKEAVNAVVHNMFKDMFKNIVNIDDLRINRSLLKQYIQTAIDNTVKQLDALPKGDATTNARREFFKNTILGSKEEKAVKDKRRAEVVRVVEEYLQKDLGIDIGLYKEDTEDTEDIKQTRDGVAKKDNTTIHPRQNTNSFVKLLIASLQDYVRDANGNMVPKTGDYFGLPELVNPGSVYNYLLKLLHTAPTTNEMMRRLQQEESKVPYISELRRLLDNAVITKPFDGIMLKVNFLQAMYNSALNYKMWLVNESDVSVVDPNEESQEKRIREKWRTNLIDSINTPNAVVVKPKSGKLPVIKHEAVKKIMSEAAKVHKPKSFEYWVKVLNDFGFNITAPQEYTSEEKDALMSEADGLFATISTKSMDLDYVWNKELKGRIEKLAALEALRNYEVTDLQHIGPDGKVRYGITQHNMVSIIGDYINSMAPGSKLQDLLIKFPSLDSVYTRNSYWLNNILFKNGKRTNTKFEVSILEGARINKPGQEGEVNTKLDRADRAWISFNAVLNGLTPLIRTSDKSLEYGVQTAVPFSMENVVSNVNSYLDVFVNYLKDELEMGRSNDVDLIKNYKKNIGDGLYFFKDILKGKVRSILPNESVEEYITKTRPSIEQAILNYLEQHDAQIIDYMMQNDLVMQTEFGYVYTALEKSVIEKAQNAKINLTTRSGLQDLIRTFSVNYFIGTIEQTKFFFGHPAFYKDAFDLFKRTAGAVGTKQTALVDDSINAFLNALPRNKKDGKVAKNGQVDVIVLEEPVTNSSYYEELKSVLGADKADKFLQMEEADGQGYITFPEYREMMLRTGNWSTSMENVYDVVMRGEGWRIPKTMMSRVFNPVKAQYFGMHKLGDTSFPVFLKFSLLPLIPGVYTGTNMEVIAESMMANGQGVAVYPSGIKLGAYMQDNGKFQPMYENGLTTPIPSDANVLSLDYRFMGIQVQTGNTMKESSPRGTQQAKVVLSNMYEDGKAKPITIVKDGKAVPLSSEETAALVKEYHDVTNDITEYKIRELLKEIGAEGTDATGYKIVDQKKLANILTKAALNRNSPDNLLDSFDLVRDSNDVIRFKYLLDAVPGRNRIENLLFSLVNNNVISQEFYGGTRIQAAGTGYEALGTERKPNEVNGKKGFASNPDLKFYRKGKFGETLPAQVKIAPNKAHVDMINKIGGTESFAENLTIVNALLKKYFGNDTARYDLEAARAEGLNLDLLQFVAYRIPTQGMNTIEHLEIIEFIDPLAGEAIHLPSELVAKSGGDFDIDKMNIYFKQFDISGNLVKSGVAGKQNRLIEINQAILSASENYAELLTPNAPTVLQNLADKLGRKDKVSSTESLTWLYGLQAGEMFVVGKEAVGIVARHITNHTLTQQAGVTINKTYKKDFVIEGQPPHGSTALNFKGMDNQYSLGKVSDVKGKEKISNTLSDFLSAFVDVVKDPFIFDINGSTKTADVYMYLIRRGLPVDTAVYFMNQPVIKAYFEKLAGAQAMFKQDKTDYDGNDLSVSRSEVQKQMTELLNTMYKKVAGDQADITKIAFSKLDNSVLKKSLDIPMNEGNIDFIRLQYQVLQDYLSYAEQANNLRKLMDATSQDTTKAKNFNMALAIEDRLVDVEATEMFDMESVDRMFENTFLKGFKKAQGTSEVFRDLFITESSMMRKAFDRLKGYLAINRVQGDDANAIMDKAKNDFIVYLASRHLKEKVGFNQADMFLRENATAETLAKTLKSPNPAIRNNPFYKNAYPLLENIKANVKGIKLFNTKLTTFDFNQLVNGLRGVKDPVKRFEYAVFILMQSGLDNSPITWYDKVPVEIMSTVIKPALETVGKSLTEGDIDVFFDQFIRNNYINSNLVPTAGVFKTDGASSVRINKAGEAVITKKKFKKRNYLKVFAPFPKYYNDKAAMEKDKAAGLEIGEMLLLQRTNGNTFRLITKLGDRMYMKEYNYAIRPSIIDANNPNRSIFRASFPNWSEPASLEFNSDAAATSLEELQGKEIKTKCKGKK